ncbi:hypothetical protein [Calidithermus roseus]|uniref:LydA holin phage, holin superfamily III n=1 Tax=Calidithermus roseus TaxID=1644118 RepID=A0A399F0V0_9DEIN|nr:hypothetical protein [Calidithermus roseus]RIH89266.1 hypothetical protein Mrose_00406 [Calidithermus roseus]
MKIDGEAVDVFRISALFAAIAALLSSLASLLTSHWPPTPLSVIRATLNVASTAFWGGISGWTLYAMMPSVEPTMLAAFSAVIGSYGHKVSRRVLLTVLGRVLNLPGLDDERRKAD